ncbi:MAG: aquaporin family protein [Ferruginibacter sp.]|nr:aquaporin family protein [Cytophagales bacterium]
MLSTSFTGELIGTAVLILLGNGVVANNLLSYSKGQNSGWMTITTGWAFAVTIGIFVSTAFGSPDAHLNPAITVGLAFRSGDFSRLSTYIPAQLLGAFVGSVLVWVQYIPHWSRTPDAETKLACFSTSPAIRHNGANFVSEALATAVLVIGASAIGSKAVGTLPPGLGPFLVGGLVWGIGLSLGGSTGYAINPVRDLGPRLAHALLPIAGKGGSQWGYAWIPTIAPLVGAILAGLLLKGFGI